MMREDDDEIRRLQELEAHIREIAEGFGLLTKEIEFEIVPAKRVMEGMAYHFPTNYSHWFYGREYDRYRTIYEHSGTGLVAEQVWNFERPKAFIIETNPFALKVLTMAHVFGHVDFFLGSRYLQHGRSSADLAEQARLAAARFRHYEERYGREEVERIIDAGMSIQWHQPLDPFAERIPEEELRERMIALECAKLEAALTASTALGEGPSREQIREAEKRLRELETKTPIQPDADILGYIIEKSPILKPWMRDVLTVLRDQARSLAPVAATKMLNEGWATYWHVQIVRQLFRLGLLSPHEHGVFADYHARLTEEKRRQLNVYRVGSALFEDVKERWDRGMFGRDFEECDDAYRRAHWDTGAMLGTQKIFEIRSAYSDRMAVEEFFDDTFIRDQRLYIYEEQVDRITGDIVYVVKEDRPEVIRELLRHAFTFYGVPLVYVSDGNAKKQGILELTHVDTGYELDPEYAKQTLAHIYRLWGKTVHLKTHQGMKGGARKPYTYSYG